MWIKTDDGYVNTDNLLSVAINENRIIAKTCNFDFILLFYKELKTHEDAEKQLERVMVWIKLGCQVTDDEMDK